MSLFKEKDDIIVSAFRAFDSDSEDDVSDETLSQIHNDSTEKFEISIDEEEPLEKRPRFDVNGDQLENFSNNALNNWQQSPPIECINIDDDSSERIELISEQRKSGRNSKKRRTRARRKSKAKQPPNNLPIEPPITISSDEDEQLTAPALQNHSIILDNDLKPAEMSQDLEDRNFTLKLSLSGAYKQFRTTYKTRLCDTLRDLVNELQSQGKDLIITYDYKTLELNESPHSLNLSSGVILEAIEVVSGESASSRMSNPDEITIKVQDGNRKHTKQFRINKKEPICHLKEKYREEFKLSDTNTIKLTFDGDLLDDESTPEELDIEDDCIIDVMVH